MSSPAEIVARPTAITGPTHVFTKRHRHRTLPHRLAQELLRPRAGCGATGKHRGSRGHRETLHRNAHTIVPQGGNTGLVGGTPDATGNAVVISMRRLNRIRAIDPSNNTLTAEAGCILQIVQEAARNEGRLFPLSLAAEGSCTIGGNLSTNAGGTNVLRYGNARDLVLGIEAVLPDGRVWHGLKGTAKGQHGLRRSISDGRGGHAGSRHGGDFKALSTAAANRTHRIGRDGLTRRRRKLFSPVACRTGRSHRRFFELMSRLCLDGVMKFFRTQSSPSANATRGKCWCKLKTRGRTHRYKTLFERALGPAFESGLARDAVVSQNVAQARALWTVRERIPEAERLTGKSVKHDISVPVSRIAEFIARADAAFAETFPSAPIVCFDGIWAMAICITTSPFRCGTHAGADGARQSDCVRFHR